MIKGPIQEEDITIINIYAPNIGALQYIRQLLTAIKVKTKSSVWKHIKIEDVKQNMRYNTNPFSNGYKYKVNKKWSLCCL